MLKLLYTVLCLTIYFCLGVSELLTYRLSLSEAIPSHYSLTIKPDFNKDIFYGKVIIDVTTTDSLNGITLHSHELNISGVYINRVPGYYEENNEERITVKYYNASIQPGEHNIIINYIGKINDQNGFIKVLYNYKETKPFVYVANLEPTNARKVFPCFDEPEFKATFTIRLISPNESIKAISNMPEINKVITSTGVIYDFQPSVKMSTYLIAFAFTNFPVYEDMLEFKGKQLPINIYAVNASKENNEIAIEATKKAIAYYSDYTSIDYPLPKLDMIEYKRERSAATENWGLITFREGLLTKLDNAYEEYQMRFVIFHELSHFWFGNLVTNSWWNDIWLNEGFATYMSYKLTAYDGSCDQLEIMQAYHFNSFLDAEVHKKSRPVVGYLSKQSQLADIFSTIEYEKASAILLMLEDQVGEEKFQEIIRCYLNQHAYSTATTNDFITAVEEIVPDKPLRIFLESYLYQSNFPLLYIDIVANSTYILKQLSSETLKNSTRWTIPISYITDANKTIQKLWFDKELDELKIEEPDAKWILFNPKTNGLYSSIWSKNVWDKFIKNVQSMDSLATETVFRDAFYSFRLAEIGCDVLVHLLEQMRQDDKRKLLNFYFYYEQLKDDLLCYKYNEEFNIFNNFLTRRYKEITFLNETIIPQPCTEDNANVDEIYLKSLNQCAVWIKENLQEKESNLMAKIEG